jgi:hypothetical protein
MPSEFDKKSVKSNTRITINSMLVGVAATVLFIIIAINPKILQENFWLSLQLVLITPFLIISSLAYSKLAYKHEPEKWNVFAWICFIVGYCFMINVIAILMAQIGLALIGILFIASSLVLNYIYASLDYSYGGGSKAEMMSKYVLLTILHVALGLILII